MEFVKVVEAVPMDFHTFMEKYKNEHSILPNQNGYLITDRMGNETWISDIHVGQGKLYEEVLS